MSWDDGIFPNADDPDDVEYMIMYWRTVRRTPPNCPGGNCNEDDFRHESRQFDHLPKGTNLGQAQALFNDYVTKRRDTGDQVGRKGQTLFLCKVERVARIHDNQGRVTS